VSHTRTVEDRISEYVLKQFPLARKRGIKSGEKWLETGLLDSLGILDLVQFLEQEFSIQIADDEMAPENFESLDVVASFVSKKSAGKSS